MYLHWLYHGFNIAYNSFIISVQWLCDCVNMAVQLLYIGFTMDCQWIVLGLSMACPWLVHGFSIALSCMHNGCYNAFAMHVQCIYHVFTVAVHVRCLCFVVPLAVLYQWLSWHYNWFTSVFIACHGCLYMLYWLYADCQLCFNSLSTALPLVSNGCHYLQVL